MAVRGLLECVRCPRVTPLSTTGVGASGFSVELESWSLSGWTPGVRNAFNFLVRVPHLHRHSRFERPYTITHYPTMTKASSFVLFFRSLYMNVHRISPNAAM